jgi:molybdate transport system substrate-binding protein
LIKTFITIIIFTISIYAKSITIFAASDLKFALEDIKKEFLKSHKDTKIDLIFGSSGKGMMQIRHSAPYDLYFSANMDYVKRLYKDGYIVSKPKLYAIGRLVIWSKNSHFDPMIGFENFKKSWVKRVTIANPSHAPYGEKAKEALQNSGIYPLLKDKLILGENISQTANYIAIKSVDIGIIAQSLVLAPVIKNSKYNSYYLIDDKLHKPLYQGYGITKYGKDNLLAKEFYNFLATKEAKKIMSEYGFKVR